MKKSDVEDVVKALQSRGVRVDEFLEKELGLMSIAALDRLKKLAR